MKTVVRPGEPQVLVKYRLAQPESSWDEMKDDPYHGGQTAYREVKVTLVRGNRCLCAYCESRIAAGTSDEEIAASRRDQRVEHFHPKSDLKRPPNWAMHWQNMWAVCHGGSDWPPKGEPLDPAKQLPPLEDNLTCDAFKDQQISKGLLQNSPEGWILSPDQIPPFPNLFQFAPDGTPEPHMQNCAVAIIPGNNHPDTYSIVAETVRQLNLGCTRLNRNRRIVRSRLEKQIARERKRHAGQPAANVLLQLARHLFSNNSANPWPEYFTLVRWRLGKPVELRLQEIGYQG